MASAKDTATFFVHGNSKQFDYVLKLYPQALKLKAEAKSRRPEELIKLDDWYQNELPETIKQRGKDAHLVHEELVQVMKWKQSRGKIYPQLSYLIKVNTPRAVMQETKKAFRKLPNLEQALTALSNLKGVGTTMASALLAAAAPDSAPFMADECLMAIPDIESIDYTAKEYLNFVQHIQSTVSRLNSEKDSNNTSWSAHRVELAVWTHYIATQMAPELLEGIPTQTIGSSTTVVETTTPGDDTFTATNTDNTEDELDTADENSLDLITTTTKNNSGDDESRFPDDTNITNTNNSTSTTNSLSAITTTNELDKQDTSIVEAPPSQNGNATTTTIEQSDESNLEQPDVCVVAANGKSKNGVIDSIYESAASNDSCLDKPVTPIAANDETNDSDSQASSIKRSLDCDSSESHQTATTDNSEPDAKKVKIEE